MRCLLFRMRTTEFFRLAQLLMVTAMSAMNDPDLPAIRKVSDQVLNWHNEYDELAERVDVKVRASGSA